MPQWRGRCALPTLVIRLGVLTSGKRHKPTWPWPLPLSLGYGAVTVENPVITSRNSSSNVVLIECLFDDWSRLALSLSVD